MSWLAGIWTRIAAAFTALVALALVAGSGLAQELDYTLEELEDKIDKSPKVKLLLARLDEKRRAESVWNHIHVLGQASTPSGPPTGSPTPFGLGSPSPSPSRPSSPRATRRSC